MNVASDYRDSHTAVGKGKVYHSSFSQYSWRRIMWEWEQRTLVEIFEEKLPKDGTIMDFACGTGRILNFLQTQSPNVTGVDISDSMLEVTRKNLPNIEIVQADLTRDNVLKEANRQFDVITSFRFFLKAQNELRIEVLDTLHPLLKEHGTFVVNNHGPAMSLGVLLEIFYGRLKNLIRTPEKKVTFYRMSHKHFKKLLNNAGFEIETTYHRSVFPIMNEKTPRDVSKFEKFA